jgi:hypothetical protein
VALLIPGTDACSASWYRHGAGKAAVPCCTHRDYYVPAKTRQRDAHQSAPTRLGQGSIMATSTLAVVIWHPIGGGTERSGAHTEPDDFPWRAFIRGRPSPRNPQLCEVRVHTYDIRNKTGKLDTGRGQGVSLVVTMAVMTIVNSGYCVFGDCDQSLGLSRGLRPAFSPHWDCCVLAPTWSRRGLAEGRLGDTIRDWVE